jgi:DNA adenine methylase
MNRDAIDFLAQFSSDANSLIYFDPPYVASTRKGRGYGPGLEFADKHTAAAAILLDSPAHIAVSGYDNELYDSLYPNWHKIYRRSKTNIGRATEIIWLSPRTYTALKETDYASM